MHKIAEKRFSTLTLNNDSLSTDVLCSIDSDISSQVIKILKLS